MRLETFYSKVQVSYLNICFRIGTVGIYLLGTQEPIRKQLLVQISLK